MVQEERVLVRALVRGLQLSGLVPVRVRVLVRVERLWALRRWHHRSQGQQHQHGQCRQQHTVLTGHPARHQPHRLTAAATGLPLDAT